ncbi:hypothetical protein MSG28_010856 [Choristoneura fumiferana]|uniref:Uncharacterized protein n=1 Tax=Choristoneura fumiferana TaxID=7141 RepID=A0ACC0KP91_CHOFU|nr:hypothetical protein MSG28_010856 [Choristoneura fumiferana]
MRCLVFPIFLYGAETWTLRKQDRRKIDALEMWCWRRLLRIPWTAHRTNVSILKELNIKERLSSTVQIRILKFFGHIIRNEDSMERLVVQGKVEGKRSRGRRRLADCPLKLTEIKNNMVSMEEECSHQENEVKHEHVCLNTEEVIIKVEYEESGSSYVEETNHKIFPHSLPTKWLVRTLEAKRSWARSCEQELSPHPGCTFLPPFGPKSVPQHEPAGVIEAQYVRSLHGQTAEGSVSFSITSHRNGIFVAVASSSNELSTAGTRSVQRLSIEDVGVDVAAGRIGCASVLEGSSVGVEVNVTHGIVVAKNAAGGVQDLNDAGVISVE